MKTLFLGLLLTTSVFAQIGADAILRSEEKTQGISNRLERFSKRFLGKPYGFGGPLGEGPQGFIDQDPLYRFDTFDCTTYVETIVSLARATTAADFEEKMNEIRYENGEVDYLKRNHFTDLQWIPNNIQNGILEEINHEIVPRHVLVAQAMIDIPNWIRKITVDQVQIPGMTLAQKQERLNEFKLEADRYSPVLATVEYVPISYLLKNPAVLKKIPHGTLVNFVRPNWDLTASIGTHQNISHQAILIRRSGVLYQRHASPAGQHIVTEISFIGYLKQFANHPTLKGVHFMRVR